jgi:tRNA dimethylallyltransferase
MRFAILGPTASGKSALAVEVARRVGGTVVNGDPFQALSGVPIGTGQPSGAERGAVPHVGYGVLPLSEKLNPADFGAKVRSWLETCSTAVLVTGSGLYLRGIWNQLDALPDVPTDMVLRVRGWQARLGAPMLHRFLRAVDPQRASELHPNDGSRIQRALALHVVTGRRSSDLMRGVQRGVPEGWKVLLVMPTREAQRSRVQRRVRTMVEQGWEEEVHRVVNAGHASDLKRLKPLGYVDWMDGGDAKEIEARIVQLTQAYAKRQVTFFRNQWPEIPVWDPDGEALDAAFEKLGL